MFGVHRTLIDVKSNKDKGVSVYSPVFPDIDTPHEAHIHIESQSLGCVRVCVRLRAHASYVGDPDHTVEVGDCGGLETRGRQENVEYFCSRAKSLDAARDRLGVLEPFRAASALAVRPGLSRWSALDRDYRAAFVFDFQEIQILLLPLFEVFT